MALAGPLAAVATEAPPPPPRVETLLVVLAPPVAVATAAGLLAIPDAAEVCCKMFPGSGSRRVMEKMFRGQMYIDTFERPHIFLSG